MTGDILRAEAQADAQVYHAFNKYFLPFQLLQITEDSPHSLDVDLMLDKQPQLIENYSPKSYLTPSSTLSAN
jgi:hypothetical protein